MSDTSDTDLNAADLNAADLVDYEVGITVDRATNPTQYIGRTGFLWTGSGITLEVVRPKNPLRFIRVDSLDPQFWVSGWGEPISKYEPVITTLDDHYQETLRYILTQYFEENVTAELIAELSSAVTARRDLSRRHIPGVTPPTFGDYPQETIMVRIPVWKANIITLANLNV